MAYINDNAPADGRSNCQRPPNGPLSRYFPNNVVYTHANERALFYDDLLRGKTVLIHCMSIRTEPQYRSIEKLAAVNRLLGDRVGREVFLYSVTVDPDHDTPRALSTFAEQHGTPPGWLFLTAQAPVVSAIRGSLFATAFQHEHGPGSADDCSMSVIRYGNEAVGLWASVPVIQDPQEIVKRLDWIRVRERPPGAPRRAGPKPLPEAWRSLPPIGERS